MALNYTFSIIKPDAFNTGKAGKIIAHLEAQGFTLKAARVLQLTKKQAEEFYAVHRGRPFYGELVEFMSSAPCMPFILVKENAEALLRRALPAGRSLRPDGSTIPIRTATTG